MNHIAYADLAFLSRFTHEPGEVPPLGQDFFGSFSKLRLEREHLDERLMVWTSTLSPDWLVRSLT